jgi:hypothetical protein
MNSGDKDHFEALAFGMKNEGREGRREMREEGREGERKEEREEGR